MQQQGEFRTKAAKLDSLQSDLSARAEAVEKNEQEIEASREKLEALRQAIGKRDTGLTEMQRAVLEHEKSIASQPNGQEVFGASADEKSAESAKTKAPPKPDDKKENDGVPSDGAALDMDDEMRERIRILRRMGYENKSDAELVEQIRRQRKEAPTSSAPAKRSWWGGKK